MARKAVNGNGFLTFYQQMAVNNPCYKKNKRRMKTTHLILHSTGANNPNLKRYVTPDDGMLGENKYKNGWNSADKDTLVHGVIGKNKNGVIEAYQIAPWGLQVWGCGSGSKGSGNSFAIQIEICEDQTLGAKYAKETYEVAVKLYAHLCKAFNVSPDNIWSHKEAHTKGYASNHGDPEHWWKKVGAGLTMDGFRKDVAALLSSGKVATPTVEKVQEKEPEEPYKFEVDPAKEFTSAVRKKYTVTASGLNMRKGAGTTKAIIKVLKKGDRFTCYGYYSKAHDGSVWLLGMDSKGAKGYCRIDYLKEL